MPSKPLTWWEARAPSEEIANTLHPSLIKFLKSAWDEDVLPRHPFSTLFLFIGALKYPDALRDRVSMYEDEDEDGRFIKLYESSHFQLHNDEGILYGFLSPWKSNPMTCMQRQGALTCLSISFDQTTLKASFIEDYNDSPNITSHKWGWIPLEAILDSYVQMIDEKKVQTISEDQAKLVKSNPSCHVVDQ